MSSLPFSVPTKTDYSLTIDHDDGFIYASVTAECSS